MEQLYRIFDKQADAQAYADFARENKLPLGPDDATRIWDTPRELRQWRVRAVGRGLGAQGRGGIRKGPTRLSRSALRHTSAQLVAREKRQSLEDDGFEA